jgi:hypothetical protein
MANPNLTDPKTTDLRNKPSNPSGRVDAGTAKTPDDGMTTQSSTGEDEATPDSPVAAGQTTKM